MDALCESHFTSGGVRMLLTLGIAALVLVAWSGVALLVNGGNHELLMQMPTSVYSLS